jgi:hypothetical protein
VAAAALTARSRGIRSPSAQGSSAFACGALVCDMSGPNSARPRGIRSPSARGSSPRVARIMQVVSRRRKRMVATSSTLEVKYLGRLESFLAPKASECRESVQSDDDRRSGPSNGPQALRHTVLRADGPPADPREEERQADLHRGGAEPARSAQFARSCGFSLREVQDLMSPLLKAKPISARWRRLAAMKIGRGPLQGASGRG